MNRRTDADETQGRLLYRQRADAEARMQLGLARKVRLMADHWNDNFGAAPTDAQDDEWDDDGPTGFEYPCPRCNGTGQPVGEFSPCPDCLGEGYLDD
jgi:hypothetical protein